VQSLARHLLDLGVRLSNLWIEVLDRKRASTAARSGSALPPNCVLRITPSACATRAT
jgi:hypothetical protein